MSFLVNSFKSIFGTAPKPSVEEMARVRTLVDSLITANPIMIFSKAYCPYCSRAKGLLADVTGGEAAGKMKVLELDQEQDGSAIQAALANRAGKGSITVPQIYIHQKLVGGCDDLMASQRSGELAKLLQQS